VEQPLLVAGRKFDIRIWVLVTHQTTYVFKQGYIRTTSSEYTLDAASISKPEVHLTNNAI
jgi:tubulin--tyrosine ligase/tubulin polyglutamylase TTLL9